MTPRVGPVRPTPPFLRGGWGGKSDFGTGDLALWLGCISKKDGIGIVYVPHRIQFPNGHRSADCALHDYIHRCLAAGTLLAIELLGQPLRWVGVRNHTV